jgi:hypothetical protein
MPLSVQSHGRMGVLAVQLLITALTAAALFVVVKGGFA